MGRASKIISSSSSLAPTPSMPNTNYIYVNLGIVFFWLISELKEFSEGGKNSLGLCLWYLHWNLFWWHHCHDSWGKESENKINVVTYNSYSPKEKSRIFYKLVQNNPDPWISFAELLSPDNDVAKTRSNVNISRVVGQDFFSCWSLLFLRIAIFFLHFWSTFVML